MQLRDDPRMSYRDLSNWPPIWVAIRSKSMKKRKGEIGILENVKRKDSWPSKCFLIITHNEQVYMGCLIFDDPVFCNEMHRLLREQIGRSIKDIGDVKLSRTLSQTLLLA